MLFKAIVSGIDKDRRLILEDIIQSDSTVFRDHCWTKPLSDKELGKARKILNKYGGGNSEPIYFYADVYWYGRKKALKNIRNLTHEDQIMVEPISFKVSRRANSVYIKLNYVKITEATQKYIKSLAITADSIDIGSDHITCKWDFLDVDSATIVRSNVSTVTDYFDAITYVDMWERSNSVPQQPEPIEEPTECTVDVHVKLPKCHRVFKNFEDIRSINTELGPITRDMVQFHNMECKAIKHANNPPRYVIDGITIHAGFVKEVEHAMEATFDCVYATDEFLRIEDSCIVISRNGETILLSNELMSLHDQTTEIIQHDGMYFLPEDTEFSQPISTQLMKLKKVTNKL